VFSYRCKLIPENNSCSELLLYKHYIEDAVDTSLFDVLGLNTLGEVFEDSETCRIFFEVIVCFYKFSPCDTNSSKLLPFCLERCWEFDRIIETCGELVSLILSFYYNCFDPETYFPSAQVAISNTSCSKSQKCIKLIIYK